MIAQRRKPRKGWVDRAGPPRPPVFFKSDGGFGGDGSSPPLLALLVLLVLSACAARAANRAGRANPAHTDLHHAGRRHPARARLAAARCNHHARRDSGACTALPTAGTGGSCRHPVFAQAGYAVFAPGSARLRRHGGPRPMGRARPRLVDDAAEMLAQLRARYPRAAGGRDGREHGRGGRCPAHGTAAPDLCRTRPCCWRPRCGGAGRWMSGSMLFATLVLADAVAPHWVPNAGSLAQHIYASDNIPALIRFGRDPLTLRRGRCGGSARPGDA